jgi:hypothetical protein
MFVQAFPGGPLTRVVDVVHAEINADHVRMLMPGCKQACHGTRAAPCIKDSGLRRDDEKAEMMR